MQSWAAPRRRRATIACAGLIAFVFGTCPARGAQAPQWMHALTGVALPAYEERTQAVELYADTSITVQPNGKITRLERKAYKILRPDGAKLGQLGIIFVEGRSRVTDIHAWCIPAGGKDYAVKQRDSVVVGLDVPNGMLASDIRALALQIPASAPGNIIGYEVEIEQTPDVYADLWSFQGTLPVREAHYNLQLPSGWSYKATWLNHAGETPLSTGANQWRWTLEDLGAVRVERHMPPLNGVAGALYLTLLAPQGARRDMDSWSDVGAWYTNLARGRRDPSPLLKQKVAELTASTPTLLAKMQALASFVQNDIRYVAIELGIGSFQPHPAADVLSHEYGDCKDKATLLGAMLEQIGVESYPVIINASRGVVTQATPPNPFSFNHAILAIALPASLEDPAIEPIYSDGKLGKLLFFDPTNPVIPFGSLSGSLQGNFGLLVTPDGGELVQLPALPPSANGVTRTAMLTLDESGTLRGDVREIRQGERAAEQRFAIRATNADTDRIRPIERLLSNSLSSYQITKASVVNLPTSSKAFEWRYSFEADRYGKVAGDVLLIRPRVVGSESRADLESRDPREHPYEFEAPERDSDSFEIALPPGYQVDSLPQPVDVDAGFATYHSRTELIGRTLRYTRSYEIDKLSVSAENAKELRTLFRTIEADERNEAVLKRAP